MKRFLVLTAVFCLLSISAFAQKATDFSGEWTLNKDKSTLSDRMKNGVESMTMTVAQTDKDIKVTTATKRMTPPAGAPGAGGPPGGGGGGMGGGGGRGMGGGMGGGDQTMSYTLDGKATDSTGANDSKISTTGKWDGAKLNLNVARTFTGPNGEIKTSTNETWELQSDGSLKVKRTQESPRGTDTNEMVFTKKGK